MSVTDDELELPTRICSSMKELADQMDMKTTSLYHSMKRKSSTKGRKIVKVEL